MPYLTPETLPSARICRRLFIPNDIGILAAVNGALAELTESSNWESFGAVTPDEISTAMLEMLYEYFHSEGCLIGAMMPYAGLEVPSGMLPCDGATYQREDYPELYAYYVGTDLIVNDDEFITPTWPDRTVIMAGDSYEPFEEIGEAEHTLIEGEMPIHTHSEVTATPTIINGGVEAPASAAVPGAGTTGSTGGGGAHNNMQPSIAFKWGVVCGRVAAPAPSPEFETFYLFDGDASSFTPTSGDPVNLGTRFYANQNGYVVGCRLWIAEGFTGARSCYLWTDSGDLLASASFPAITGIGWLEIGFDDPVGIEADTTYVMSIHTTGEFVFSFGYFSGAYDNNPLFSPADSDGAPNGAYAYGSAGTFPNNRPFGANYWINPIVESGV